MVCGPIRKLGVPGYDDLPRANVCPRGRDAKKPRHPRGCLEQITSRSAERGRRAICRFGQKLRETVEKRPDDIEGHRILVGVETGLENYRAALRAQKRILDILGGQAGAEDFFEYAQLMIFASGMYVSPEAEDALRAALARSRKRRGALLHGFR